MPSPTEKSAHFFQMVKAIQAGHDIEGVSGATKEKLHKAANSMTHKQVADFAHVAKRPKAKQKG
jgi:uncharacterized lipoprotein YajG